MACSSAAPGNSGEFIIPGAVKGPSGLIARVGRSFNDARASPRKGAQLLAAVNEFGAIRFAYAAAALVMPGPLNRGPSMRERFPVSGGCQESFPDSINPAAAAPTHLRLERSNREFGMPFAKIKGNEEH